MTLDEAIKRFESIKLYKSFEEFIEDCGDSRVKDGVKICGNPVNSLLFRGYGICDEDHCPDYKRCVERAEEHRQLAKWLEELQKLKEKEPILDKITEEIQKLRGCSCSCSDGIIDDVENIIDKYKVESEVK